MRFTRYDPDERLRPFVRYYAVSETEQVRTYKVFPAPGIVIGFQYGGRLSIIRDDSEAPLSSAGITGIADGHKVFRNSANTGTVLVYFTESGFTHFTVHPANELFNLSLSLDNIFDRGEVKRVEEELVAAYSDGTRIAAIERFLFSQLKEIQADRLIAKAVRMICQSKGTVRIRELIDTFFISQSPFEKRFRKLVGTSLKKFASLVRFNAVLNSMGNTKSLTDICYEHNFLDQAHFIRDFQQFTGDSPEHFRRFL